MKKPLQLRDLIDLTAVQTMADSHFRAAGMPIGIIDAIDGSVLVGSGWQDICVKFHRANPLSLQRCHESDDYIKNNLVEGESCRYKCRNGLWDIGIPIIVKGQHLATMFLGQFFYEGEAPDREFFHRQAVEFGFDHDAYLAALERVPILSHEKVATILDYNRALVVFIASLAEKALSQMATEALIRQNEERFALVQRVGNIGIWDWDIQTGALFWSEQIEPMFGFARGEFAATYEAYAACIYPEDRRQVEDRIADSIETGREYSIEHRILWPDGTIHWVSGTGTVFYEENGRPCRMVGVALDITERKRAEEEIHSLNDELEQRVQERTGQLERANRALLVEVGHRQRSQEQIELLNANLRKHSEALENANQELESFCYTVSHDLRAPLRHMAGFSRIVLEDYGDAIDRDAFGYLERIERASTKMGDLIDALLQLSRISRVELSLQAVDLSQMAAEIVNELQEEVPSRQLRPQITTGLVATADRALMQSLLRNLLGNAVKYTRDTSPAIITFSASEKEGGTVFCIRDNGTGFDMAHAKSLFKPFQRLHGKEYEGTGIGLATVQRIVHRHGGSVWVEAEPGKGAAFSFTLGA